MSTRTKLNSAFRNLRAAGYVAKQNWKCCQGCGWAAMPQGTERAVFYHAQDATSLHERKPFFLAWAGNGAEIVSHLQSAGLAVEWDGSERTRIKVTP